MPAGIYFKLSIKPINFTLGKEKYNKYMCLLGQELGAMILTNISFLPSIMAIALGYAADHFMLPGKDNYTYPYPYPKAVLTDMT